MLKLLLLVGLLPLVTPVPKPQPYRGYYGPYGLYRSYGLDYGGDRPAVAAGSVDSGEDSDDYDAGFQAGLEAAISAIRAVEDEDEPETGAGRVRCPSGRRGRKCRSFRRPKVGR